MLKEYRLFGPPGTGKTSKLATDIIPKAVKKYGADKVLVVSFTRAGAREIATKKSRDTGMPIEIPSENVGTLHSICFHALGCPKIIETDRKLIQQWNEDYPQFEIYGKTVRSMDDVVAESSGAGHGDYMLSLLNIRRNKMLQTYSHRHLSYFEKLWKEFKESNDCVDFTDLIEKCLKERFNAPGDPSVMIVDEAQDSTILQLSLVRSWGESMEWIMLVGDDDQTIYRFAGATPNAFLEPKIEEKDLHILDQSYRVPQSVLDASMNLISKVSNRYPKKYHARKNYNGETIEGEVLNFSESEYNWRNPESVIEAALEYFENDKKIMFLASCSYMLDPTLSALRAKGLPFHNPYRKTRGDWNPLQSKKDSISSKDLLLNFLGNGIDGNYWNIPQFVTWAQYLKTGPDGMKRKIGKQGIAALKEAIKNEEPGLHTARDVLPQLLNEHAVERAMARDLRWFEDNMQASRLKSLKYPQKVYERRLEIDDLEQTPKIIIGTIHSVKGGESDVVVLFPDISFEASKQLRSSNPEDVYSIYRVFYVGMTRARETLIVTSPTTKGHDRQKVKLYVELLED